MINQELIRKITDRIHGKISNNELKPKYCPFCKGGERKNKDTFAFNVVTGTYNCKRGTCGVKGNAYQLADFLGIEYKRNGSDYFREYRKPAKVYKKPEKVYKDLSKKVIEYFKTRGISEETLIKNKVTSDKHDNAVFNYYRDGELTFVKYKLARKPKEGENKSWREKDTEPILYGMDDCDFSYPLIIIEGEADKLVLDECRIPNCVSIPSGTSDLTWITTCWEWLENFNEIILWGDNDSAGKTFVQNAIARLDTWKLRVVKCEHKDANVLLYKEGTEAVFSAVNDAIPITKEYITEMADVKRRDYTTQKAIPFGFYRLDRALGGNYPGQLIVWSGYTGAGKSTFLNHTILNGIDHAKTFVYSGELSREEIKEWFDLQCSGREFITSYNCPVKGEKVYIPDSNYFKFLDEYYYGKLFLYDSDDYVNDGEILKAMEYMAKREGVEVFVVDNLMTVDLGNAISENSSVSRFLKDCKKFARKYNVAVHLVAHPKKPQYGQHAMTIYDVSGSGNIVNLCDRLYVIHRISDKETEEDPSLQNRSSKFKWFKDRKFGITNGEIAFSFEYQSKRFYNSHDDRDRQYPWVNKMMGGGSNNSWWNK